MKLGLGESATAALFAGLGILATVTLVAVPPVVWRDLDKPGLLYYIVAATLFWALGMPVLAYFCQDDLAMPWYVFGVLWIAIVVILATLNQILLLPSHHRNKSSKKQLTLSDVHEHVIKGNRFNTWRKKSGVIFLLWVFGALAVALLWYFTINKGGLSFFGTHASNNKFLGLQYAHWFLLASALFLVWVAILMFFSATIEECDLYINYGKGSGEEEIKRIVEESGKHLKRCNISVFAVKCCSGCSEKGVVNVKDNAGARYKNISLEGCTIPTIWVEGMREDVPIQRDEIADFLESLRKDC
jgi:hypothetical protein